MSGSKFLPARWAAKAASSEPKAGSEPIADLDAMLARPKSFRLFGRWRELKPLTTAEFYAFMSATAEFYALKDAKFASEKERSKAIADKCFEIFKSVCDDLTREEVDRMALVQCLALFGHITDSVTGKLHEYAGLEGEKKNQPTRSES